MTVKEKLDKRTSRLLHFMMGSLMIVLLFTACNKENGMPDNSDKTIWISMNIAIPERILPTTKSTIIDPDVTTPAPDREDGIGLENTIHTVRLFVFDLAGNFVANILNAEPNNKTITTGAGSRYLTTLYFKLNARKGKYKLVLVANEEMLDHNSRLALLNFQGTRTQLLNNDAFMSIPLEAKQIAGSTIAFTGESDEFDLSDATKYFYDPIYKREYFQINTEVNPVKMQRICAKVELTITNQNSAGEFIKPESAFFKLNTLRRIDIRNTTSLFKTTTSHPESLLSSEVSLTSSNMTGINNVGEKFTFKDEFYAGEYTEGIGFGDGTILNADRQTSSAFFLQLEDINGAKYDYIIPIGDPIRDNADKLTGMSMERNVIYRINVDIIGKHIKVFFIFRVAPEETQQLPSIDIYPKNKQP